MVEDLRGRPLADLRVSVTDRCNLRCTYCMPREVFGADHPFLPQSDLLTFEEIERLARLFIELGVRKVRLTGGEPLLRRDLPQLVAMIAALDGLRDLSLTTNGVLLPRFARPLALAGLRRVTVSLDAVDEVTFRRMNGADASVAAVMEGIEAAVQAGLGPVKINAVVQRGVNEHSIVDLVERFRGTGHVVRFIEYMDVGTTNGWRLDSVVSGVEILERLRTRFDLEPVDSAYRGEVAKRWRHRDGGGEIGLITSVSGPFCGDCTRARLSPEGSLFTCLFAARGTDLRGPLRGGESDEAVRQRILAVWRSRDDRYSEIRGSGEAPGGPPRVEMSHIGG